MLRQINTAARTWPRRTTPVMAALLAVGFIVSSASAEPLNAATAKQAFALIEAWAGDMVVPDEAITIELDGVVGAEVTLRFEGSPIGVGRATLADPLSPVRQAKPVDLTPLLREAMALAINDARKSLTTIVSQPGRESTPKQLERIAPLLRCELQVARVPQRVRLRSLQELPRLFKPGLHGLALRHGDEWAWVYPGTAVTSNISLTGQLQRMLEYLNLPAGVMPIVGSEGGPSLYRFAAMHVVRAGADAPPRVLHRGTTPLPRVGLNAAQIADACTAWSTNLRQRQNARGQFTGTYEPTANRNAPAIAPAESAALACLALARYARLDGIDDAQRDSCADAARFGIEALLNDLGIGPRGADASLGKPARTAAAATTLLALMQLPDAGDLKPQRERLGGMLLAAVRSDGKVRTHDTGNADAAPRPTHAMVTYALTRMYRLTRNGIYLKQAKLAAASLSKDTTPQQAAGAMPWFALAEFELLQVREATTGLVTARRAIDLLWSVQVPANSLTASADINSPDYISPDTIGGFALDNELLPEPTWHSAGPTVALAAALPIGNFITDAERIDWLVNTTLALRFLDQLTMRADDGFYAAKPNRAVGGVRSAPWDNRQPLSATAMALLAAAEFQHSLNTLSDGDEFSR